MSKVMEEGNQYFMSVYNRFPIVLEKGEGVYLYDENGKKYLDFASGIAVFALGYHYPGYDEALKEQIDKLIHTSNLFYTKPAVEAAKKFCNMSGMDKVFFTNSGAEAIEGAIKLARRYYYNKTGKAEGEIIAMNHSFHGRTMGALSVTGQLKYQEPFAPMIGNVSFAQFNDLESVKALITDKTCGIILEAVQGEGGLNVASQEFMKGVRALCDEHDLVLILDEIQCGMGRTGKLFAFEHYKIKPDVMTSAKALGCGVPVGLFAATGKMAEALKPGDHGSTYGGNPLVTKAVETVLDLFERDKIVSHAKEVGDYLTEQLDALVADYDFIVERRGRGLMQGLVFTKPVGDIIKEGQKKGLIVISAGSNIIRFVPSLIITNEHVDEMITILKMCLS